MNKTLPVRFRSKPVVIEAMRLDQDNWEHIEAWSGKVVRALVNREGEQLVLIAAYVDTLECRMTAQIGDWIIRGLAGEFYPCKPDIFERKYEEEPHA